MDKKTYYYWRLDFQNRLLSAGKIGFATELEFYKALNEWNNTAPGQWQYGQTNKKTYERLRMDN